MIIEKTLAISFWVGVAILALIGSVYFNVWAETPPFYTNDAGHNCYYALTPDYVLYDICYPSLDDRLLGEKKYTSLDEPPELTYDGVEISLQEGNTLTGSYTNAVKLDLFSR